MSKCTPEAFDRLAQIRINDGIDVASKIEEALEDDDALQAISVEDINREYERLKKPGDEKSPGTYATGHPDSMRP